MYHKNIDVFPTSIYRPAPHRDLRKGQGGAKAHVDLPKGQGGAKAHVDLRKGQGWAKAHVDLSKGHRLKTVSLIHSVCPQGVPLVCTLRGDYGSTSTQHKGVTDPLRPRAPPQNINLLSRRRSSEGCDRSTNVTLMQNQNRFRTASKRLRGYCVDVEP